MSTTKHIGGQRLNGEMTRTEQRDLKVAHDYLVNFVTTLTQAIREHADGKAILARAEEIRNKSSLPISSSQVRRKNKQRQ